MELCGVALTAAEVIIQDAEVEARARPASYTSAGINAKTRQEGSYGLKISGGANVTALGNTSESGGSYGVVGLALVSGHLNAAGDTGAVGGKLTMSGLEAVYGWFDRKAKTSRITLRVANTVTESTVEGTLLLQYKCIRTCETYAITANWQDNTVTVTLDVRFPGIDQAAQVLVAWYQNGRMTGISMERVDLTASVTLEFERPASAGSSSSCRIFLVGDTISPLCPHWDSWT